MNCINNPHFSADELEGNWRGMNLIYHLFVPDSPKQTVDDMLQKLSEELQVALSAERVRVFLRGEKPYDKSSPYAEKQDDNPNCVEEYISDEFFRIPIIAGSMPVGCVEAYKPCLDDKTANQNRMLVKAVAAHLGLIADRAAMLRTQNEFVMRVSSEIGMQAMYQAVCDATEKADGDVKKAVDSMVHLVGRGIPSRVAVAVLWDNDGNEFHCCSNGDHMAKEKLEWIARAKHEEVKTNGYFIRSFRRREGEEKERDSFEPLTAVLILPLKRFKKIEGLLAVARDGKDAEFTTDERNSLGVLSSLVSEWNISE